MQFYNPKMSTITLNASLIKQREKIQIAIAKTLDPNRSGRPQKGEKIYDNEHAAYFSLTPEECARISHSLPAILEGTYVDPKERDEKFKKSINITHFRDNSPSKLLITRGQDRDGKPTQTIILTLLPPNEKSSSYVFRPSEFIMFRAFIEHGWKDLPYDAELEEARRKRTARENYESKNKSNDQSGRNQQSTQQSTQQSYTPPVTETAFDDSGVGPVDGTAENVDDLPW